ncbi:hypothetical protein F511_10338 [Dorcoceras hygrometricum]|uniref:Uncharacterized protein n=1 Tax=Dorcoceras hygrometricum TaxID=472368 RepID=A0A2Z7CNI9_9LAMI|nr:hypothetical protein F511_10338 [Dorcoceras hygrometricum]
MLVMWITSELKDLVNLFIQRPFARHQQLTSSSRTQGTGGETLRPQPSKPTEATATHRLPSSLCHTPKPQNPKSLEPLPHSTETVSQTRGKQGLTQRFCRSRSQKRLRSQEAAEGHERVRVLLSEYGK